MFDANKLLNQMFGSGGANNPLGQIGGMLGGLLNDSVTGMKEGAAAIEQKTGIGARGRRCAERRNRQVQRRSAGAGQDVRVRKQGGRWRCPGWAGPAAAGHARRTRPRRQRSDAGRSRDGWRTCLQGVAESSGWQIRRRRLRRSKAAPERQPVRRVRQFRAGRCDRHAGAARHDRGGGVRCAS